MRACVCVCACAEFASCQTVGSLCTSGLSDSSVETMYRSSCFCYLLALPNLQLMTDDGDLPVLPVWQFQMPAVPSSLNGKKAKHEVVDLAASRGLQWGQGPNWS